MQNNRMKDISTSINEENRYVVLFNNIQDGPSYQSEVLAKKHADKLRLAQFKTRFKVIHNI